MVRSTPEIRRCFPALERREGGVPVAYFDGPGGTQVPRAVGDAVSDYLYHHNANTHWAYPTSVETDAALAEARETFAAFLNCAPREVVFGANMTSLTLHVSRAMGLGWGAGDEVIVTELDHHANIDPWRTLARERGLTVHMARMDPQRGVLDWEHLTGLVNDRTRLIAIGAASNALGSVTEVGPAVALARRVGALVFVDAVHYAQHQLVDVADWDCDLLACSAYKFYGPHVGVLYVRDTLLESLPFARLEPAAATGPERAESGTLNHEGIVGAAAAVEWLGSLSKTEGELRSRLAATYAALDDRSRVLATTLWDGLGEIGGVSRYGPPPTASGERMPTIGFTVNGVDSRDVNTSLAARGVFTSHGDFYALTVIRRLGLEPAGLVRAGCACYTTADEVQRLIEAVKSVAA